MDLALKIGNIVGWVVMILVFYFGGQASDANDLNAIQQRVSILEVKLQQESINFQTLSNSINLRLESLERKLDKFDRKFDCYATPKLCVH